MSATAPSTASHHSHPRSYPSSDSLLNHIPLVSNPSLSTLYIPTIPAIILLIMIFAQLIREKQERLSIDELLYCEIAKVIWVVPSYVILAIELYKYARHDHPSFPPVHRSAGDYVLGVMEAVLFAP